MDTIKFKNSNNIGDVIQNNIVKSIANDYVTSIHTRSGVLQYSGSDIYTETRKMGYVIGKRENIEAWSKKLTTRAKPAKSTTDVLIKIVEEINAKVEEELKKNIELQIKQLNLKTTANPFLMSDKNGSYYRFEDNEFVLDKSILNVDEYGNYTVITSIDNSSDKLIVQYNTEHKPILFKLLNKNEETYKSSQYVANKLKMKQELVKKHKLHGYSGNSKGFVSKICNLFSEPTPSSFYMYKNYDFFRWNQKKYQFEIQERTGKKIGSPMLADYEFTENAVIRTDYDGQGILL